MNAFIIVTGGQAARLWAPRVIPGFIISSSTFFPSPVGVYGVPRTSWSKIVKFGALPEEVSLSFLPNYAP